jgi:ABC-type branched-subunit amino acid transport system ATPase component
MTELLRVESLTKAFGGIRAVDDVSMSARTGEILGIIGPNGAGKTSLLNCITGLLRIDAGEVWLGEQPLTSKSPLRIARAGVSRTLQLAEHFRTFRVHEYVMLGRGARLPRSIWTYGLSSRAVVRTERAQSQVVDALLSEFGLEQQRGRLLGELSYGTQKLVDIVRAVAAEPVLLLLDEPTSGCSQEERFALESHVERLRQAGTTCVIVDHDVGFLSHICDRLLAMSLGKRIQAGLPKDVLADPEVIASYLGNPRA